MVSAGYSTILHLTLADLAQILAACCSQSTRSRTTCRTEDHAGHPTRTCHILREDFVDLAGMIESGVSSLLAFPDSHFVCPSLPGCAVIQKSGCEGVGLSRASLPLLLSQSPQGRKRADHCK